MNDDRVRQQRAYYAKTANRYDEMHLYQKDEHYFALAFLVGILDYFEISSILDVGSGTGRAIRFLKEHRPDVTIIGVEPVAELREAGYKAGVSESELVDGDATSLVFDDGSFDLVCEFGVLHHVRYPHLAVSEMLRVARKGVFISDSNRFGQGSFLSRTVKQTLAALRLWNLANLIKTRGKGFTFSDGDGLAYSYSVFDNLALLRSHCQTLYFLNTINASPNLYRTASHLAILGIK